jgi:hypothetical protein
MGFGSCATRRASYSITTELALHAFISGIDGIKSCESSSIQKPFKFSEWRSQKVALKEYHMGMCCMLMSDIVINRYLCVNVLIIYLGIE